MNSFYYTIISDAETLSAKGLTSISLFSKLWAVKIHPHSPALVVLRDSRSCFRQSKSYILLNSRNPYSWLSSGILYVPDSRTIWRRYRFVIDIFRSGNSRNIFKRKLCYMYFCSVLTRRIVISGIRSFYILWNNRVPKSIERITIFSPNGATMPLWTFSYCCH